MPELMKLLELAAEHPEIGPPLAGLASKIGQQAFADRVVRLGLEHEARGVEYAFVAANAARRDGRYEDALRFTVDAVRAFAAAPQTALTADDGPHLLHLVRNGFATLLFDVKDLEAPLAKTFVGGLGEHLPGLEARLGADAFYHVLVAQTLWFQDRTRSENEWERAAELGEPEHTWNARGTWYKEAEKDLAKAERAYRAGLDKVPQSALLLHNIAQLMVEKAAAAETSSEDAWRLLKDANEMLRAALREDAPKGLRRHVHVTLDRLNDVRSSLPPRPSKRQREDHAEHAHGNQQPHHQQPAPPPPPREREPDPEIGQVVTGRVTSLTIYGAFLAWGRHQTGLLHKSEISHERVDDPAAVVKVGDELEVKVIDVRHEGGRLRVGLSRKALLPAPERTAAPERPRAPQQPQQRPQQRRQEEAPKEKFLTGGKVSLGEMILAKLKEQQGKE
jgi:predicted RNA-binding protein with RPS1 domain